MNDHAADQRGFTVVEMLVVVALMTIVTVPILMVLRGATTAEQAQTAKLDAGLAGSIAIERLSSDIRSSTSIQISAGVLQLTVIQPSGTTAAVRWQRVDADLVRSATIGSQTSTATVLDDLISVNPATPFTAYDKNGNQILTSAANCPGYVDVVIDRSTETLTFSAASRSLNAGLASC